MILDKIYVHIRTEQRPSITFSETLEKNSSNIAYIRKDALLEYLNKCKDNPVITELQKGNIQELIDKINSL